MSQKQLTNIDMNANQILNVLAQVLASDPGSPAEGQFWYDSTNHVFKFRNNSATIILGRLDQISQPTADVTFNSHKATNVLDPTNPQDAATKAYVDSLVNGLDWKASARVATTANVTVAGGAPTTVDGVTIALNDRILVKAQTAGAENGIYTVTTLGTGVNGTWTRAADADASVEVTSGMAVPVNEGTAGADTVWVLTTNDPITLATTALVFSKAFTAPSVNATKYTQTIGDGSTTAIAVTHNLGQQFCTCQAFDASTGAQVECDIVLTSTTVATFTFALAPATNAIRVVIVG